MEYSFYISFVPSVLDYLVFHSNVLLLTNPWCHDNVMSATLDLYVKEVKSLGNQ